MVGIAEAEGPRGFFKGWTPVFCRFLPTMLIQMTIIEQLRVGFGVGNI